MAAVPASSGRDADASQELAASSTQHKAAASKAFLENHYKSVLRGLQEPNRVASVKPRGKDVKFSDFEILKLIGRGAFGEVYMCRKLDDPPSHALRAMKRMRKVDMLRMKQMYHVRSERNVMAEATVANPWVVELQFSFQDETYLYMVMEYAAGGDMMSWLIAKEIFTNEEARFYVAELAMAVHSVHSMRYVHRDLKPDNILVDARGHIKLSDFGLCRRFDDEGDVVDANPEPSQQQEQSGTPSSLPPQPSPSVGRTEPIAEFSPPEGQPSTESPLGAAAPQKQGDQQLQDATGSQRQPPAFPQSDGGAPAPPVDAEAARRERFESVVGSPGYIAPEILRKQKYGINCDWWSVGVIMYEMVYGCPPFYAQESHVTTHKILNWSSYLRFPPASAHGPVTKEAIDLMRRLLCDSKDRLDWSGIRSHPFFAGIEWERLREIAPSFKPELSSPTDTRYFPELDDRQRIADAQHVAFMNEIDPRGVLFADFGFKK